MKIGPMSPRARIRKKLRAALRIAYAMIPPEDLCDFQQILFFPDPLDRYRYWW